MVHVNRKGRDQGSRHSLSAKQCVCVGICVIACSFYWYFLSNNEAPTNENALHKLVQQQDHLGSKSPPSISVSSSLNDPCPYMKVTDLNTDERHPKAGPRRHLVTPPEDGPVTLVCCSTTKGPWNILVHHNWAPHGAERFVAMVRAAYFQNQVPLMRCVHNFLCQCKSRLFLFFQPPFIVLKRKTILYVWKYSLILLCICYNSRPGW